jgi:TolB protein
MSKQKLLIILILFVSGICFSQQRKIAYCSNITGTGILQIFIMNEDGSDKKQLTNIDENCMKPKWSPDGKQIVFYSDAGQIYLIRNVDTESPTVQPYYVGAGVNPSFLPDGGQIIYNDEYEGVLSIFIIDTTQGSETNIISDGRYSNMQTLSDEGNKIIYSAFINGYKSIMVADLDDTTNNYISKISRNDEANLEPDISSDGSRIVYASFDNNLKGTIRIFENGKETALSKGLPSSNVPRFSPDASKIAFVVIDGNNVSLYLMDSDGSNKKDLHVGGGNIGTFQWIDNDTIVYDVGSETRTSVGIINIKTGANKILADGGFNLQPCGQK